MIIVEVENGIVSDVYTNTDSKVVVVDIDALRVGANPVSAWEPSPLHQAESEMAKRVRRKQLTAENYKEIFYQEIANE